jgi:hypothetical protein
MTRLHRERHPNHPTSRRVAPSPPSPPPASRPATRRPRSLGPWPLALVLVACGAPLPSQAPPPPPGPQVEQSPATGTAAPSEERPQQPFASPPPGRAYPQPATTAPLAPSKDEAQASALVELSGFEAQLATMLGAPDCANACRALRSMGRAAARVCDPSAPATPAPPAERDPDCADADARLAKARSSVLAACGACPESR